MATDYSAILPYCQTDVQREYINAIIEHGSTRKAAKALGKNPRNLFNALARIRKYAALKGLSPEHDMTHPTPDGFFVKGVSTYYNDEGKPVGQWVKTQADLEERNRILLEVIRDSLSEFEGKAKRVSKPKAKKQDLMAIYPMGDPHIGMYAWGEEAGEDFDTEIASRDLHAATRDLVSRSPDAETGVILSLGDFFHSDTMDNKTRRSGHVLDVDTRWARVLRVGVDLMVECVYAALEKHKRVVVRNLIGNHDDHSSMFLSVALDKFFAGEKRVTVDQSPANFWYHRFGKVLIGATHGDTVKPDRLPGIMAADRAEDWGLTKYRYWYTGHIHCKNSCEFPGVLWESFRTLAAKDAWTAASGYRAGRDMQCIVHHADYGEVARNTVSVDMIR